ncbi:hypothetical protein [Candidiatus Paracoxiella cheracis]|uniref:hypothetical protein n=1 Tax=Candidiatus Paracoxiella cheracis TaxID=3405120 RepID=UPI003BF5B0A8
MNRQNTDEHPASTVKHSASGSEPNILSAKRIKKKMLFLLDCQSYAEGVLAQLPLDSRTLKSDAFRDQGELISTIQRSMIASKNSAKELAALEQARRAFMAAHFEASACRGIQESRVKDGLPSNSRTTQNNLRRQGVYEPCDLRRQGVYAPFDSPLFAGHLAHTKSRRRNPQLQDCASSPQPEDSSSSGLLPLPAAPSVNTLITSMGACSLEELEESNYTSEAHSTLCAELQSARTKLKKRDNPAPKNVRTGVQGCVNHIGAILMDQVQFRESTLYSHPDSQRSSFFEECGNEFHSNTTLPIRSLASPSNLQSTNPNGLFANKSHSEGFKVVNKQKIHIPSGSENDLKRYLQKQNAKRGCCETILFANPSEDTEYWGEEKDQGESVVFGAR